VRQDELLRTPRQCEPGRLAGQPQRHLRPGGHGHRRDGEALRAPLRRLGAACHLHDEPRCHGTTLGCPRAELVYTLILAGAFLVIGWFSVYVVYKLYQGQR